MAVPPPTLTQLIEGARERERKRIELEQLTETNRRMLNRELELREFVAMFLSTFGPAFEHWLGLKFEYLNSPYIGPVARFTRADLDLLITLADGHWYVGDEAAPAAIALFYHDDSQSAPDDVQRRCDLVLIAFGDLLNLDGKEPA